MLREQIKRDIAKAIKQFTVHSSQFTEEKIEVTRTSDAKFGDYSTNIALRIASSYSSNAREKSNKDSSRDARTIEKNKQSSVEIAKVLADSLKNQPYLEKLEVAGGGFLNFFIKPEVWQKEVEKILKADDKYGLNMLGKGKAARIEFVSANPTGPLHFGNVRGGPIGDAIASVLEFSGWKVLREYINNDRGNQVLELGKTIAACAGLLEIPQEELTYKGDYIKELAAAVADELGQIGDLDQESIITRAGELGVKALFSEIIRDCEAMGVTFDYIVHESELQKKAPPIISDLEKKGILKWAEGAVWLAPKSQFIGDKEAVVVKSDGSFTYFTADVVYHKEKFESGYDLVIDVFGSNTFGHVPKLRALAEVYGFDLANFIVILYQFVRIKRGNDIVKMSKRAGTFVTVREVLDEVGRDALRFFILMHDPNSHIDFDLELAKKKSKENPVYYVQYAHARICSVLAKAISEPGLKNSPKPGSEKTDHQLLTTNYELALIKQITRLPELVEDISSSFAVHRLTAYATELADSFHRFYENCRVIGEKEDLMQARISLIMATKIALANTLELLGISAPEKM